MPHLVQLITYSDRCEVAERLQAGSNEEDIASFLNMPIERVRRLFRRELDLHPVESKHKVLSKIYEAATSGKNIPASIFWAKSRFGWRDTGAPGMAGSTAWQPFVVEIDGAEPPHLTPLR
jgi:hypothetical protein